MAKYNRRTLANMKEVKKKIAPPSLRECWAFREENTDQPCALSSFLSTLGSSDYSRSKIINTKYASSFGLQKFVFVLIIQRI